MNKRKVEKKYQINIKKETKQEKWYNLRITTGDEELGMWRPKFCGGREGEELKGMWRGEGALRALVPLHFTCKRAGLSDSLTVISLGPLFYTSMAQSLPVSFIFFWSHTDEKAGSLGETSMHRTKFEGLTGSVGLDICVTRTIWHALIWVRIL